LFRALLIVIVFCLFSSEPASANNEYSEGVSAYIDGKFELAQTLWLRAAKDNDPRAMFNLGLLHSEGKIMNGEPAKAERWFKLAGQNGYAPADYHFAKLMLEQGRSTAEIKPYLQRALKNGSYPAIGLMAELDQGVGVAKSQLQLGSASPATFVPAVANVSQKAGAVPTPIKGRYLTEDWIASRSSSEWTIQMLAFQEKDKIMAFIDQHELHRNAAYFAERADRGMLYKLIYGAYETKEQADVARRKLSKALREYGPWLRSVASVKEVIAKQ
jgi:TPR repeat protein